MIICLLKFKKTFVHDEFEPNSSHYSKVAARQTPKVVWPEYADARVGKDIITGFRPATICVQRNIASMISFNDAGIAVLLNDALVNVKLRM